MNLKHEDPLFYYILQTDISQNNGPGVNEWEFVNFLLEAYPDNVVAFAPNPDPRSSNARKHPNVHYVMSHRGRHPLFYIIFLLHQLWVVFRTALQRPPSAIVVRPSLFPIVSLLASYVLRVPLFLKTVSLGIQALRKRWFPFGRYVLYPLNHVIYRLLLRRACLIDTVTQSIALWYTERTRIDAGKFVVIPNAVNTSIFRHAPKQDARRCLGLSRFRRVVGYVGGIAEHSGIRELIEGTKTLAQTDSDIGFVIVGDGELREDMENLVGEYGLYDQFIFTGRVAYSRIHQYINAFDVGIALFPTWWMLRNGSSSQKVRQYLACQRPVLASRGEGHEFIQQNQLGWLVVPEDPAQVAEAIVAACSTPSEQLERMGHRGREYVIQNFSVSSLTRQRYEIWVRSLTEAE